VSSHSSHIVSRPLPGSPQGGGQEGGQLAGPRAGRPGGGVPLGTRLRGGSWRYAVPTAGGAGAAKFRENLRRLGGEDLLPADRTAGTVAGTRPATGGGSGSAIRDAPDARPTAPPRTLR